MSQHSTPIAPNLAPITAASASAPAAAPVLPAAAAADLKLYVRLAWRWAWLVVLCALIGGAAAYLVSVRMTPIYQAASKVIINEARTPGTASYGASYNDILASERVARTYADLMLRSTVRDAALVRLGIDPARDPQLAAQAITAITATPVRDTQLVALMVEGPYPDLAAALANALPTVFVEELREIQAGRFAESKASLTEQLDEMSRQVETLKLQLAELEAQHTAQEALEYTQLSNALTQSQTAYTNLLQSYETLRLTEAQSTDSIVLIEPAAIPNAPVRPRVLVNTLLAAVLGALAALGIVFLVEYLDDRIRTPEDLARIVPLSVLGGIGMAPTPQDHKRGRAARRSPRRGAATASAPVPARAVGLISLDAPRHAIVEAYRRLRTNLQYANLDCDLKTLLITSAISGEGKSITAANLAVVMAQAGVRVILIDADLRKPRQHQLFGLYGQPGLTDALRSGEVTPELLQKVPGVPMLRVLTAGEIVPNPSEVLGSQRMRQLAADLQADADILIFDTPPLLAVTDAAVVGRLADGALLVVDSRKTPAGAVQRTFQALQQVNVNVVGAVLNRLATGGRAYDYYYYYTHASYGSGNSGGDGSGPGASGSDYAGEPVETSPSGMLSLGAVGASD